MLADWIELAAYLAQEEVYRENAVAMLEDSYFVRDQDEARREVSSAWRALEKRVRHLEAAYPFDLSEEYIVPSDRPAVPYRFMLVLSAPEYLDKYSHGKAGAFRSLFEIMSVEAVRGLLGGWSVVWSGALSAEMKAADGVVPYVASLLRTKVHDATFFHSAQDGGVDFLAVWKGIDDRSARPAIWGQCASGADWLDKLQEPNFNRWQDAIRVLPDPVRAITIPFSLDQYTFTEAAIAGRGWIVDRLRIASGLDGTLEARLQAQIEAWIIKQMAKLPLAS